MPVAVPAPLHALYDASPCEDYHNATIQQSRTCSDISSLCESTIDSMLSVVVPIQYANTYDATGEIEPLFLATVASWGIIDVTAPQYKKPLFTSVCVATTMFSHVHPSTQLHIALYSLLAGCVDDLDIPIDALQQFAPRLNEGETQGHPILELLVRNLKRMPEFYPNFSATAILAGTIQFVNATLFDKLCESGPAGMPLRSGALPYAKYKRARNSLGEVFALFAWDKHHFPDVTSHIQVLPDTRIYLDYANDILSFYKEELAGERDNFVHDYASATGKPLPVVLDDIVGEISAAIQRVRTLLSSDCEARDAFERLVTGYIAFHLISPRYRLGELGLAIE